MTDFGPRLAEQLATRGRLCVGVDPHPQLLQDWGLTADVAGLAECVRGMVDALGDLVAVFKPQSALFEAFGSAGIGVLERFLAAADKAGAMVIMDAKRGDIGSTMAGYARAYLSNDSPLAADALTVSPYLGFGSLTPAIQLAEATGRGLYVLCRTSNPEGSQVQLADAGGRSVAQLMVDEVNAANAGRDPGPFGLVIGGTLPGLDVDLTRFTGSILVPGIGAQGGTIDGLTALFGSATDRVLPTSSRGIMGAGPNPDALRRAVTDALTEVS
ncbi:orotidine-5'-phosphate decarboxylase [Granulicoccus sp. GXG6511]|uniref:orotidine-5'-phosphate decarboxylase n=1 Tax=Granulicoccus sp. GXG6511 TaxID=3381351 RepID=UPI003D7C8DD8